MNNIDKVRIFKALSNDSRLQILEWLKNPKEEFDQIKQGDIDMDEVGVCVSQIKEKLHLTQSTTSEYLTTLMNVELLIAQRIGKWTYYKRNEQTIKQLGVLFTENL